MVDLLALTRIYLNGKMYQAGQLFQATEAEARPLILKGAAKLVSIAPGTPILNPEPTAKAIEPSYVVKDVQPSKRTRKTKK